MPDMTDVRRMHSAIMQNNIVVVNDLLRSMRFPPNSQLSSGIFYGSPTWLKVLFWGKGRDEYEFTGLHLIAKTGHVHLMQPFLQRQANVDARDYYNRTPLHIAIKSHHIPVIQALIVAGADNSLAIQANPAGFEFRLNHLELRDLQPIHYSAIYSDSNVFDFFINLVNVDQVSPCKFKFSGGQDYSPIGMVKLFLLCIWYSPNAEKTNLYIQKLNSLLQTGIQLSQSDFTFALREPRIPSSVLQAFCQHRQPQFSASMSELLLSQLKSTMRLNNSRYLIATQVAKASDLIFAGIPILVNGQRQTFNRQDMAGLVSDLHEACDQNNSLHQSFFRSFTQEIAHEFQRAADQRQAQNPQRLFRQAAGAANDAEPEQNVPQQRYANN